VLALALERADELPLGSGACSGSSLPIDRACVAELLAFSRITPNALDTVGDRDFALDWAWAAARVLLALGKLSADLVDYATSEFGLVKLDGAIAAGSSMMPQKKNPDVFELVRGKTARGIGNVVALLTLVKGLPSGYNRDQQEDRATLLETGPLVRGAVRAVRLSLPHVAFVPERGLLALADGYTQATDMAEALVRVGVPFREAYKAVGQLVRVAVERGVALSALSPEEMRAVKPEIDARVIAALDPAKAVSAKESLGGTGPRSVGAQIELLREAASALSARADAVPTLEALAHRVAAAPQSSTKDTSA
jgi:argininosuccinate lyase